MNIFINGTNITINNEQAVVEHALEQFLSEYQQQTAFAVALNSDFVGRDDYATTPIKSGDSIDVLFPIQGG